MLVAPGTAFVRIQVEDEYGLYAPADPVTGLALPAQRPLWFRKADMGLEGGSEPEVGRGPRASWQAA